MFDSSAVVAAMAESSSQPVKTFSIGFEEERFNELPQAKRIAMEFATDHHELVVHPDAIEILPKLVRHYGEPFADASALPSFYLARFASEHVTVALNGDGGDESFAGYPRYTTNLALAQLDRLPHAVRRAAGALARRVPSGAIRAPCAAGSGDSRWRRRWTARVATSRRTRSSRKPSVTSSYTPEYAALLGPSRAADTAPGPMAILERRGSA